MHRSVDVCEGELISVKWRVIKQIFAHLYKTVSSTKRYDKGHRTCDYQQYPASLRQQTEVNLLASETSTP